MEIWCYIILNNLEVNPKYKKGYKRVGCAIACPYSGKSTWYLDKYFYPKMYDRWHRILTKDFIEHGKWCTLNCTLKEYQYCWNGGVVREQPTKEVIEEFMQYKGIDSYEIAENISTRHVHVVAKYKKQRYNSYEPKMHGRNITRFMCKNV